MPVLGILQWSLPKPFTSASKHGPWKDRLYESEGKSPRRAESKSSPTSKQPPHTKDQVIWMPLRAPSSSNSHRHLKSNQKSLYKLARLWSIRSDSRSTGWSIQRSELERQKSCWRRCRNIPHRYSFVWTSRSCVFHTGYRSKLFSSVELVSKQIGTRQVPGRPEFSIF